MNPVHYPPERLLLIFNPASGPTGEPALQSVVAALQGQNFLPEVFLVLPDCDLPGAVKDARERGHRLFAVCGGDGTIDTVAGALAGSHSTLGIIPAGTQNNVALSLNVPVDVAAATALLRTGRRLKIDLGLAALRDGGAERIFVEACSVGLLAGLFPSSDDIQHGNLARVSDFLSTLIASPVAHMQLTLDGKPALDTQAHVAVAANMPYTGPHYAVAPDISLDDGLLDVVVFADLSKLDLLSTAWQVVTGGPEDARIRHFRARQVELVTDPPMPIVVDGFQLGEGPLRLGVKRRALRVIAGEPPAKPPAGDTAAGAPHADGSAADAPPLVPFIDLPPDATA